MALDQPKLMLLANVISITAVPALTLMWFLRKKDQQKLIGALTMGREPERRRPEIPEVPVAPPPPSASTLKLSAEARQQPVPDPAREATPVVLPAMDPDVREFVTRR